MERLQFNRALEDLMSCSTYQFRIIQKKIEDIKLKKCVSVELETPVKDVICPHCKSTHFQKWGIRSD